MTDVQVYGLLADAILVVHFAFVVFVVVGFILILIGLTARWSWIQNRTFRVLHLAAIVFVVVQTWFGQLCPLTVWENDLRHLAGQSAYTESFVEYWLHKVLFYQAAPWVFTVVYTGFGALVVLAWFFRGRGKTSGGKSRSAPRPESR